jgi:hypothetical protein
MAQVFYRKKYNMLYALPESDFHGCTLTALVPNGRKIPVEVRVIEGVI